jgi:hypothetical protein
MSQAKCSKEEGIEGPFYFDILIIVFFFFSQGKLNLIYHLHKYIS